MPPDGRRLFDPDILVPAAWRSPDGGALCIRDAAIHRHGTSLLLATEGAEGRIALCRLDDRFHPIPGSLLSLSDHLTFADGGRTPDGPSACPGEPRFVSLGERLFLSLLCERPPSPARLHLLELDPVRLLPLGPARPLRREGPNDDPGVPWTLFAEGADLYAIACFVPLVILKAALDQPDHVPCRDGFLHRWDAEGYVHTYGALRGGAPPVRHGARLYLLPQSAFETRAGPVMDAPARRHTVVPALALQAHPPFAPVALSAHPVLQASPVEAQAPVLPDTHPSEELRPSGAVADGEDLIVSITLHGRSAGLHRFAFAGLDAAMQPALLMPHLPAMVKAPPGEAAPATSAEELAAFELRSFWWLGHTASCRDPALEQNRPRGHFAFGNFGDITARHLLARLVGVTLHHLAAEGRRLLTVGSILGIARDGDVIWGSGCNGARATLRHAPRHLHVYATRGPISLELLRRHGIDTRGATRFLDPASLLPHLFAPEIAAMRSAAAAAPREPFVIIPHFRDQAAMRQRYPEHLSRIQTPDCAVLDMVARILRSELVVSSSLHGLILAEALGVPAIWHRPMKGEDELKFTDYYLGTDRWRILRVDTLAEAIRATPMELPRLDGPAMLATFPSMAALQAHGVLLRRPSAPLEAPCAITTRQGAWIGLLMGWETPRADGAWTDGRQARLALHLGERAPEELEAVLTLRPMLPGPGRPQVVTVRTKKRELAVLRLTDAAMQTLRVPLRGAVLEAGALELILDIAEPTSPPRPGGKPVGARAPRALGIFLSSVMLTRTPSQG